MIHDRFVRTDRLRAVEREYMVLSIALARLQIAVADVTVLLPDGTSTRDLVAAKDRLEATYLIRLWAEFETAVRSFYSGLQNDPNPSIRAADLINSVAASRRRWYVADSVLADIHEVRVYRNSLLHDRDEPAGPITVSEARRRLNTYLGSLPRQWKSPGPD